MKKSVVYLGDTCVFRKEFTSMDEAQAELDKYCREGVKASCLHENGKHQIYVGGGIFGLSSTPFLFSKMDKHGISLPNANSKNLGDREELCLKHRKSHEHKEEKN